MERLARAIAFYLPQYYPTPENDAWWGKGFTEWTNVAKARPLFRGHYQPHIPADLGFYDLRVEETRIAQAELAREYGIEAFCYYHYWFAGKRMLERPFNEVLASGKPDFKFCLCWANETWTNKWHGGKQGKNYIEQTYPGSEDYKEHFKFLLKAFRDKRYLSVDGKPLLCIYKHFFIPDNRQVAELWRKLAKDAGLPGLYLVGCGWWYGRSDGYDAFVEWHLPEYRLKTTWRHPIKKALRLYRDKIGKPAIYSYKDVLYDVVDPRFPPHIKSHPTLIPNYDTTPRLLSKGMVFHNSTPELFRLQIRKVLDMVKGIPLERRLIFIKSWNEWAEGNYLEPDLRFGKAYLEVLKNEIAPDG